MTGWEQNHDPASFLQADVDEAAERLAEILREEHADVLTVYDWHGNYGHPDHIKVHTVGHRAGELAGVERVFEATMNRDHIIRMMEMARAAGAQLGDDDFDPNDGADDGNPMGMSEAEITHAVDVTAHLAAKRDIAALSPQPDHRHQLLPGDARRGLCCWRSARSGSSRRVRSRVCAPVGCSNDAPVSRSPRARRGRLGHRPGPWSRRDRAQPGRSGRRSAGTARPAADAHQSAAALPRDRRRARRAVARRGARRAAMSPRSRRRKASPWRIESSGCGWRWVARGTTSAPATSPTATRS